MTVKKKAHVLGEIISKPDISSSVGSNHNSPNANPSKGDPPDPPEREPLPPNEEGLDPDKDDDNDKEDDLDVDSPIDNL